jgi:hypothetical protein
MLVNTVELSIKDKKVGGNQPTIDEKVLSDVIVEIKYLASSWLDDFEKQQFDGKTVSELLNKYDDCQ